MQLGSAGADNEAVSISPLKDPATGENLPARRQPGYYPGFSTLAQQKYWDAATRMLIHRRVTRSIPIRFFTSDEEKTMRAVVDRILPQEDREHAYRIDVLAGIDERLFENRLEGYRYTDMPPDQDAYRLAARAFEQMATSNTASPLMHWTPRGRKRCCAACIALSRSPPGIFGRR